MRTFLVLILILMPLAAHSYEVNVHQKITDYAIGVSAMGQYLKNNLNISLNDSFNGNTAKQWIILGSKWEDDDLTMRWLNHFYDPTTGKGLNASAGLITFGDPSLQWGKISLSGWNWENAKGYYYSALTGNDKTIREKKFANVFRALGQVIHLVEDKAVPAHVRNDAHAPTIERRDLYEKYTKDRVASLKFAGYPAVEIATFNSFDMFWINGGKGLAEFTNRNFLSRDTNIDDAKYLLPVPIGEWVTRETVSDFGGYFVDVDVKYLQGYVTDNYRPAESQPLARLSAISYFDYEMTQFNGQRVYCLNDYIHKEYSDFLIPRAVGYSAGLLDYFFRGSIEISLPLSGIYSSTNDADAGFTRITLLAKNKTSNGDEMSNGTIELVVKYKLAKSDPFKSTAVDKTDFYYAVFPEANSIASIPRDMPAELHFDLGQNPLPVNATDVYLQVVYHGRLGNEDGAVAVGFKDISEPTPIDVFNNMDKICINNGTTSNWYDAGSQSAIDAVGTNLSGPIWDVYPHYLTLYVKFYNSIVEPEYASPSSYDYLIESIQAGSPMRALYVLGDEKLDYSYYPVRTAADRNDTWDHVDFLSVYQGGTVRNQEGDYPVMYTFRNFKMWSGAGFIYINAPYPDNSAQCPLSSL